MGSQPHDRRPVPASNASRGWRNLTYSGFSRARTRVSPSGFEARERRHNSERGQGPQTDIDNIYSNPIPGRSSDQRSERTLLGCDPTLSFSLSDYFSSGFVEPCLGIGICRGYSDPRWGCKVTSGCPPWSAFAQAK